MSARVARGHQSASRDHRDDERERRTEGLRDRGREKSEGALTSGRHAKSRQNALWETFGFSQKPRLANLYRAIARRSSSVTSTPPAWRLGPLRAVFALVLVLVRAFVSVVVAAFVALGPRAAGLPVRADGGR